MSTPGSKDRLWIVITGAAFPQRLSMEATLRLDWIFNVSHSCVRDKRILNCTFVRAKPKIKLKEKKKEENIEVQTQILKIIWTYSKQAGLVLPVPQCSTAW